MNYYEENNFNNNIDMSKPDEKKIKPSNKPVKNEAANNPMQENEEIQNIKQMGTPNMPTPPTKDIQCITIIGEIEGHFIGNPQKKSTKYEHIIPMLYSVEESPEIKGVLIVLNTVGGDVEAGLAMAELIDRKSVV